MQNLISKIHPILKVFFGILTSLFFIFAFQNAFAIWNPPTANPPAGNIPEPLTESILHQQTRGGLVLNNQGAITSEGLIIDKGDVRIGNASIYPLSTPKLQVDGLIHSTSEGFRFPDGTVQTTAAVANNIACNWHGWDTANSCQNCAYCGSMSSGKLQTWCENSTRVTKLSWQSGNCCAYCINYSQWIARGGGSGGTVNGGWTNVGTYDAGGGWTGIGNSGGGNSGSSGGGNNSGHRSDGKH